MYQTCGVYYSPIYWLYKSIDLQETLFMVTELFVAGGLPHCLRQFSMCKINEINWTKHTSRHLLDVKTGHLQALYGCLQSSDNCTSLTLRLNSLKLPLPGNKSQAVMAHIEYSLLFLESGFFVYFHPVVHGGTYWLWC